MTDIFIVIFLFFSIGFAVIVELRIKQGKLKRVDTYSYKTVIETTMRLLYTAIIISLVVYLFSKSIEVTISLGVLLLFGVIGGCLYGFLWEYQTKRRGGQKAVRKKGADRSS
jgi:hypothetical protein